MGVQGFRPSPAVWAASISLTLTMAGSAIADPEAPPPVAELTAPIGTPADEVSLAASEAAGVPEKKDTPPPESAPKEGDQPASPMPAPEPVPPQFTPVPDRWRIGFPDWDRYRSGLGAPYSRRSSLLNPYRQNLLKGDLPVLGQDVFLNLGLTSDTLADFRSRYIPSNVSSRDPGQFRFFGSGRQDLVDQLFLLSAEVFKGDTAFRPKDWAFRVTAGLDVNHLSSRQTGVVNVDVRDGTSRTNLDFGLQELFGEYRLADLSSEYDFVSARAGIQGFTADFRGFLFVDNQPGIRLFGNTKGNRNQFNLAYFHPLEKDTYSRLNRTFQDRGQDILNANIFRQDLFRPGYTGQLVFAMNNDHGGRHFNNNGVQTRPSLIGGGAPHKIQAFYVGWNGEGHLGRWNVNHSLYQAFGRDDRNPIARRRTTIDAQMAALEVSYDRDWARFKGSIFYASGDARPKDGRASGFDAIFDNPVFAGAGFSFWQSQGLGLTGAPVDLLGESSLLPTLRSSKLEGQANFVNPGILLLNLGTDVELTPKWRMSANANWLRFMKTQPLELVLNQSGIDRSVGLDLSLGFRHRPLLNENVVLSFGVSALIPGQGFRDIYTGKTIFSSFARLTLAY